MSQFKRIQYKIDSLQHSENLDELSVKEKQLLTELQRIKKEHSEMLEMLKEIITDWEVGNEDNFIMANNIDKAKQLIKEATQL
jgi:hypothetical protein